MIIYDDAGYIAGVQSVLLETDVDLDVNDLTKQARFIGPNLFLVDWLENAFSVLILLFSSSFSSSIISTCVSAQPVYVRDSWMGEAAWFTTAYFVDPLVICNGGRLPINILVETFSILKEMQSNIFQEFERLGHLRNRRSSSHPERNARQPDQYPSHTGWGGYDLRLVRNRMRKTWQKFPQVWSFLLRWNGRSLPPVRLHPWTGFTITERVIFSHR